MESLADAIVLCFTAVSFEAATLDILSEGKYSELMRIYPESGSSIISWKFGWSLAGSIITQSCKCITRLYVMNLLRLISIPIGFTICFTLHLTTSVSHTIRCRTTERCRVLAYLVLDRNYPVNYTILSYYQVCSSIFF